MVPLLIALAGRKSLAPRWQLHAGATGWQSSLVEAAVLVIKKSIKEKSAGQ
jgi:hypothetical protein